MGEMTEKVLGFGTQELLMRDLPDTRCRCGHGLSWKVGDESEPEIANYAECGCGMTYTAGQARIHVEGIDRNDN